jgi:prevent-host-death family protein
MEVSVRELKANLSAVLRAVESGERAVVTSHRKPVATIVASMPQGDSVDDRLIAAGLMTERPLPGPLVRPDLMPLPAGIGTLSDAVLEDRRW